MEVKAVRIFTHPYLKEALGELATKALVDDFRVYKEGKGLPTTSGRDVPYLFTHNRSYFEFTTSAFQSCRFSAQASAIQTDQRLYSGVLSRLLQQPLLPTDSHH